MLITNITDTYLKLTSDEIQAFLDTPGDYTRIVVTGNFNCCCDDDLFTENILTPFVDTTDILKLADGLRVNLSFFSQTEFLDGVYQLTVKLYKEDSTITLSNCIFVDKTIKCKVAATLNNILEENDNKNIEQPASSLHLFHYALVNGSNCGCNCDGMCEVYAEVVKLLATIDPKIFEDCGC